MGCHVTAHLVELKACGFSFPCKRWTQENGKNIQVINAKFGIGTELGPVMQVHNWREYVIEDVEKGIATGVNDWSLRGSKVS